MDYANALKVGTEIKVVKGSHKGKHGKIVRIFQVCKEINPYYHILLNGEVEIFYYNFDAVIELVKSKVVEKKQSVAAQRRSIWNHA